MMDQFPQFGVAQSLFHNFVEVELNPRHTCLSKQKHYKCLESLLDLEPHLKLTLISYLKLNCQVHLSGAHSPFPFMKVNPI